jgi:hypothetical protein
MKFLRPESKTPAQQKKPQTELTPSGGFFSWGLKRLLLARRQIRATAMPKKYFIRYTL